MFLEYFDIKRPEWSPSMLATVVSRLHDSGYQGLVLEVQQLLSRYIQPQADRGLETATGRLDPFSDILIPPAQPHARLILHRVASDVVRVVVVGRTQHEARIATTAVKMHLEAALGGRLNDLVSDENGRGSLNRFRRDVLPSLHLVGEGHPSGEFRSAGLAQLLMGLRHQPAFRGKPTVLGSQVAALAPDRPAEQTRDGLEQMATDGAVERWHVVVCKEGGQWLAVTPSAEEIKAFIASNVACPHCGRRVGDELKDVAYRMGENVQAYLADNRAMCDLVETALRRLGVDAVTMQPGAGPVDGAACYHGTVLLLRAKEGAAGPAEMATLREEARRLERDGWMVYPVLIAEQTAAAEAGNGVNVVSGISNLESALADLLATVRAAKLSTLLPGVLRPVAVALTDLLPAE